MNNLKIYILDQKLICYEILKQQVAASALKKQEGNYFDIYFNYSLDYDLRNQDFDLMKDIEISFNQELPLVSDNYEIVNSFETTRYQKYQK